MSVEKLYIGSFELQFIHKLTLDLMLNHNIDVSEAKQRAEFFNAWIKSSIEDERLTKKDKEDCISSSSIPTNYLGIKW